MNKFIIDYDKKTLKLFFEGETFDFDLTEGDLPDFWHSFTTKDGVVKDINFHQEDETQEPSLSVYDLKEETHGGETYMTTDTSKDVYIEECEKIGDVANYFGYAPEEDDADDCPNCGHEE